MTPPARVVCLGAAVLDRKYTLQAPAILNTSNPANLGLTTHGGVARNVADTLIRLQVPTALFTVIGDDREGTALKDSLSGMGVDTRGVRQLSTRSTDEYLAVLSPDGELVLGVAAMHLLDEIDPGEVDRALEIAPDWLFVDCNPATAILVAALARAHPVGVRLAMDAVSIPKVTRLPADLTGLDLLFCNQDEAVEWALAHGFPAAGQFEELATVILAAGARAAVITRGPEPILVAGPDGSVQIPVPDPVIPAVDVTGAGDALIAGTLAALVGGAPLPDAVASGARLAAAVVRWSFSVPR